MGRQKDGGSPATWELQFIFIFCDICISEIELGNRPTTHFNKDGWKNITRKFNEQTGRAYDRSQLKNKWDQLKKEWKIWKDLLRGETGIGWNLFKKTVDASDEWWNEKIQAIPGARKFRYNEIQPELEEKLDKMFSRIVATGDNVWIPNSGILPSEFSGEEINTTDEEDMQSDNVQVRQTNILDSANMNHNSRLKVSKRKSSFKRKKCKLGGKQVIMSHIEALVDASKSISSAITATNLYRERFTIAETLNELYTIPEISEDVEFFDFATDFIQNRSQREIFMGLPNDKKVTWLRRRYDRAYDSLV